MFGRRKRNPEDFSEEVRAHLSLEAEQLKKDGLTGEEAAAAAHRKFGNVVQSQEQFYESTGWIWLEQFWKDVRLACRQLALSKSFTLVAVITLALGIGANTAVFTLVHAVMLESLPVQNPEQLYRLGSGGACCVIGGYQGRFAIYSYSLYQDMRDHTPEFEELAAFTPETVPFSLRRSGTSGLPEVFHGEFVSGNYFQMFGLHAMAGRTLVPADDVAGAPPAAVLSYRAFDQRFARDPSIIGSSFLINGVAYSIAGVAPPGFYGDTLRADPPDVWLPLETEPVIRGENSLLHHGGHWLYLVGRLKSGANPAKVEAEVNITLKQWFLNEAGAQVTPKEREQIDRQHIQVVPAGSGVATMKTAYVDGLTLMAIASGLVLLIACANIANLLLARRTASRVQASIRVALGAPRHRLVRESLIESTVLALLGGVAGLLVAFAATRAILLIAFRGAGFVPIQAAPSWPVLGFAFLLSLLTGLIFGVVPAWISGRFEPADVLRGSGRSMTARSTLPQKSLVVLQAALSLVLLSYAGILTRSLRNLEHQNFGFETSGRVMVSVSPAFAGYSPERLHGVYQQLRQRLPRIPGVESASFALYSPMEGINWGSGVVIEGHPQAKAGASWDRVSAHYFETIGTRLIRGRFIDERDTPNSPFVAVVNQTFVRKFFPNEDPIGRRFGFDSPSEYEIVGVVEDAKYEDARDVVWETFFLPLLQMRPNWWKESGAARSNYIGAIQLRVASNVSNLEPQLRIAIAGVDPNLTVLNVRTFVDQLSGNFNKERLLARLTGLFGLLALLVASIGLYGITAYSVVRRTAEIGIRIALGSSRATLIRLVLRSAVLQTAVGLAVGIPVALWGGRFLASELYGIQPYDPWMLATAVAILGLCGFLAGLIPAIRAAAVDPIRALRTE